MTNDQKLRDLYRLCKLTGKDIDVSVHYGEEQNNNRPVFTVYGPDGRKLSVGTYSKAKDAIRRIMVTA